MKKFLLHLLALLLTATAAFPQQKFPVITASLEAVGETVSADRFALPVKDHQKSNAIFNSIRPVTVKYKHTPWLLMVVDMPDEKQVVHFSKEQLEILTKIIESKDRKTHYLEVTNFFDVYEGRARAEIDQQFLNNVNFAISRKHWYKNNAVFMISSMLINEQHVIRFQLPFANQARICRHVKAVHNLESEYFEATPKDFLNLFVSNPTPGEIRVSTE